MLLDTVFCGYSPHLSGRLAPENIERFRIVSQEVEKEGKKKTELCTFETPFCRPLAEDEDNESVRQWLTDNLRNTRRPVSIMTGWSAHS